LISTLIFLFKSLLIPGEYITNRYWLAGSDFGSEGKFYWMSSGAYFEYTAWHTGEPSGNNPTNGVKEDCVQYWNRNGTILWNDSPCENAYNYICEYVNPCQKYPF
jgi:Lectin C-type domain